LGRSRILASCAGRSSGLLGIVRAVIRRVIVDIVSLQDEI
jgi:hypothetical protein